MNATTGSDPSINRYRAIFISDLHLGTRDCRSDFLADFLRKTACDHLLPRRRHHRRLAPA